MATRQTETEWQASTSPRGRAPFLAVPKQPSFPSGMPQSTGTLGKMKGVEDRIRPP
ncbi:MAG: hypothetical protein ACE5Z5_13215 [Candidatus Bathyarchaeia archaeon]